MTRPKLVLPSGAMSWGRWAEEGLDENAKALASQLSDASSAGSLFASRADLLQAQIASIPSVAAIYSRDLMPFSVTRTLNPSAVNYVYDAPAQTFTPPRPDRPYNYTVFASMDVSGVPLPFSRSFLRTNGSDDSLQYENLQPGYLSQGTFSVSGSGSIGAGGTVVVEAAIATSSTGTMTFNSTKIWCLFSGSIL